MLSPVDRPQRTADQPRALFADHRTGAPRDEAGGKVSLPALRGDFGNTVVRTPARGGRGGTRTRYWLCHRAAIAARDSIEGDPVEIKHVCQLCGEIMAVHEHASYQEVKTCLAGM